MLNRNIDSIIYQSYKRLGEIGLQLSEHAERGLDGTRENNELWNKGIIILNLLNTVDNHIEVKNNNTVYRIVNITVQEVNELLAQLIIYSDITNFPIAPFIPTKNVSEIILGNVIQGPAGTNGVSAYFSIAFAEDNTGANFSATPSPARPFIAFKSANVPIPFEVSSFTGLWVRFFGNDGNDGNDGDDGNNLYPYIRYAQDSTGGGISSTPDITRPFIAIAVSLVDYGVNPPSALFNGLWQRYLGINGTNGTNGTNGNTILYGSGVPSNLVGVNNDWYINTDNYTLYGPKTGGVWTTSISLVGPIGPQGDVGDAGNDGIDGTDGISSFVYIAYATNSTGDNYELVSSNDVTATLGTFDAEKEFIAILLTNTAIGATITDADFAGKWVRYQGAGDRWTTTSTSVIGVTTGNKTFQVETDLAYSTGQLVIVALPSDPTTYLSGPVVAYNRATGQLTINATTIGGTGTYSTWNISLQVGGGGGGGTWGSITGTLSDQADLQSALNGRVPLARTITINGVSQDLSANRTYSVGDVLTSGSYSNPTWITALDAAKITTGTLPLSVIPAAALERIYTYVGVQTLPQNMGLTISNVQNGDTVQIDNVSNPNHLRMWKVIDDTQLNVAAGFREYTAGTAANAAQLNGQLPSYYLNRANHTGTQDWNTTISGKPTTLSGYGITNQIYERGGNAFGVNSILGLTDNFRLTLQTGNNDIDFTTNGIVRATLSNIGIWSFVNSPTSVTPSNEDNTSKLASTEFVMKEGGFLTTSFTSTIQFNINRVITHTITGAINFTLNNTGARNNKKCKLYLRANGVNKPTFSSDFVIQRDNWLNTLNTWNIVNMEYTPSGKVSVWITYQ